MLLLIWGSLWKSAGALSLLTLAIIIQHANSKQQKVDTSGSTTTSVWTLGTFTWLLYLHRQTHRHIHNWVTAFLYSRKQQENGLATIVARLLYSIKFLLRLFVPKQTNSLTDGSNLAFVSAISQNDGRIYLSSFSSFVQLALISLHSLSLSLYILPREY